MKDLIVWFLTGGGAALLAAALYVVYRGFRSSLRPLMIFQAGWSAAFRSLSGAPRAVVAIGLVIATGAGLQLTSTAFPIFDEQTFFVTSIVWQAVMATALAALAVFVHLFIIHDLFAERRFGAKTHFYRGPAVNQSLHPRPPPLSLLVRAGALGFGIWLLTYGLHVATNALAVFSPQLAPFATPDLIRSTVYFGGTFASFLIVTLLSLVRPALSLGSSRPVLLGIGTAVGRAPVLYSLTVLLLIPPAIIGWLTVFIPHLFLPASVVARLVGAVILLVFSIFQLMAVEASTIFLMNRAMNQSARSDEAQPAAAAAQSAQ